MSVADRGVLYIVWGDRCETLLARSIASVRRFYPDTPIHVERATPQDQQRALQLKSTMGALTPFQSTLYLDADTIVMGNLDFGFEQAERFGLACCICECPWARRYAAVDGDRIEYNTGVLFFSATSRSVFSTWPSLADNTPATSRWVNLDGKLHGLEYDDQASFARAIQLCQWNPFVLPANYNFRPNFNLSCFAPLKVWHDYQPVPPQLVSVNEECERGQRHVTYLRFA